MTDRKKVVIKATYKLLQPLIRVLLRYGVSHLEFSDLAKRAYVAVSRKDFAIPERAPSVSRIAVLTGLSRKEVVRLEKLVEHGEFGDDDIRRPINRASRAIGGWMQDPDYLTRSGKPRSLDLTGESKSFRTLVKKYSGDVSYGAILDELLRIGAVEMQGESKVKLVAQGYVPSSDINDIEKLNILGTSVTDLLTTIDHNISDPAHPRFQREVVYTELSENGIKEFSLISRDKCMALVLELNQWLAEKKSIEKRLGVTNYNTRVGIGIYYIEDGTSKGHESEDKTHS